MGLKYWETMSERENSGISVKEEWLKNNSKAAAADEPDGDDNTAGEASGTGMNEAENGSGEDRTSVRKRKTRLPYPLAVFFGGLLTLLSITGLAVLLAAVLVITVACAVLTVTLIAGGVFAIYEAFVNISSATLVSLQTMGIGFAAVALGLVGMVATVRCITGLVPKTAGLFPKAVDASLSL